MFPTRITPSEAGEAWARPGTRVSLRHQQKHANTEGMLGCLSPLLPCPDGCGFTSPTLLNCFLKVMNVLKLNAGWHEMVSPR